MEEPVTWPERLKVIKTHRDIHNRIPGPMVDELLARLAELEQAPPPKPRPEVRV